MSVRHLLNMLAVEGIGKGLLAAFLLRPNHVVIAGLRAPSDSTTRDLEALPHGDGSKVIIVKIDSHSETDPKAAVETLTSHYEIKKLDVVVPNAGISSYFGKAADTPAREMSEHFTINAVGPLLLFQATAALLKAAPKPKFVVISSGAGSLSQVEKLPVENTAYGASKAALNFVVRRIHYENPDLIAFPINPGWLQTEVSHTELVHK